MVLDTVAKTPTQFPPAPGIVATARVSGGPAVNQDNQVILPESHEFIQTEQIDARDEQPGLLSGDVGINIRAALNANGGSVRHFIIQPGQSWDFGRAIAPVSAMGYLPVVGGNPGGGWCNLAAMYITNADQLNLRSDFPIHTGNYGDRFPGIFINDDGSGRTLVITNTKDRPVEFWAREHGDVLIVEAKLR